MRYELSYLKLLASSCARMSYGPRLQQVHVPSLSNGWDFSKFLCRLDIVHQARNRSHCRADEIPAPRQPEWYRPRGLMIRLQDRIEVRHSERFYASEERLLE